MSAIATSKAWSLEQLLLVGGDRTLDVGCGTGEDVAALATAAAPGGEAVRVDASEVMIVEARRRHAHFPGVSFLVADAAALPFGDASFDACRCERTLQHLEDPFGAIAEMARELCTGGRVALVEPDWETLVVEGASDPRLSAAILSRHVARHRQPRIGRALRGLLEANGFSDLTLDGAVAIHTSLERASAAFRIRRAAMRGVPEQVLTEQVAAAWLEELARADRERRFLAAVSNLSVSSRRRKVGRGGDG